MPSPTINTGKILKTLRKMSGLSQRELSLGLGTSRHVISRVETNRTSPSAEFIGQMVKYMGFDEAMYESLLATERHIDLASRIEGEDDSPSPTEKIHPTRYVIERLQTYFPATKVSKAYLFGSYAREQQNNESDIDVLIELDENQKPTIFDLIDIKDGLESLLEKAVDVVQQGSEYAHVRESIDRDKILIYG